ncbi:MAG: hypothetical protein ACO25F_04115 [Erythrobacter sp.]
MRFPVSSPRAGKGVVSQLTLAFALASGAALVSGVVAEPAHAQREKKEKDKKKAEPAAVYSKEFVAAFQPLQAVVNAPTGDVASIKGQLPALAALSISPDEKSAAGGLIYNSGAKLGDQTLQLQGVKLMLESGKTAPDQIGRFNFIAYQLANAQKQFADARNFLQQAIANNFSTTGVTMADMQIAMAESFISEKRYAEGVDYLGRAITEAKAAGRKVDESWYRRGLSVSYNNKITPQVYDFATNWVADYPSATNWRDAINIARNLNAFDSAEMLDLLRLSLRVDALKEKYEYADYVEAADARRLPKEVKQVIELAYSKNHVSKDEIYLADSLKTANTRLAVDQAELPAFERDARAPTAALRTVMAAGDTFLSYGQYAKAEEFYTKALGMPGVDSGAALTRLGIAQAEQAKFDAAIATFAKVGGKRAPISRMWTGYVKQKQQKAAAPVAAPAAPAPTTGA